MKSVRTAEGGVTVRVNNVGGIDEATVELEPGVNVLTGQNASNRTSLLQALMAALGSDRATLKGHAEAGRVALELGEETYTRTLERVDGEVVFGGSPYTDDAALAELFAFLLESNEARQAVARGDDLREVIMRPVDTAAIREEIASLEARQREIESELGERDRLSDERDELERRCAELESAIEEKRAALETKESAIDAASAELEESRDRKAALEAELSALQDRRSAHEEVRFRLETERASLDELRAELEEVEAAIDDHDEPAEASLTALEDRREGLRERKRSLDSKVNQLQSLVAFTEEVLTGDGPGGSLLDDEGVGDVTSQLLPGGEAHRCWTCGSETTRGDIEATLGELRDRRTDLVEARQSVTAELEAVTERADEVAEREGRREALEGRRDDLRSEIEAAEATIDELEARLDDLAEEIEDTEAAVEELREAAYDEIIELHRAANALELEAEQLEAERDEAQSALAARRERLEALDALEAEQATVAEQLQAARTRIERLEDEAVETFNDQMAAVLEVLGYGNVERIWIERTEETVREGRSTVRRGRFDLHVVRSTDDGAVYEDTVAHLSESEREVTGLVFALAGYLAHDLHETMPFVLLDSIEAIDADRIALLVEYLADYAPYLVVALLPEDAAPVDDRHHAVTAI